MEARLNSQNIISINSYAFSSSNSHLWFDFVINRDKLLEHLKQDEPDPSPIVLLYQFVENAEKASLSLLGPNKTQNINGRASPAVLPSGTGTPPLGVGGGTNFESSARIEKVKKLKSMALQMAAHLNWDLEVLSSLPFAVQHSLMKYINELGDLNQFIVAVRHRWMLKSCQIPMRKVNQQDPAYDQLCKSLTPDLSYGILLGLIPEKQQPASKKGEDGIIVPTPLTFACSNNAAPDYTIGNQLSLKDFSSTLNIDIGIHLLYKGQASDAAEHFKAAQPLPNQENCPYFKIPKDKLDGYFKAVGILCTDPESPEDNSELKAVDFARLLRKGHLAKIKKLVGGDNWAAQQEDQGRSTSPLKLEEDQCEGESIFELERRLLETQNVHNIKELLMQLHTLTSTVVPAATAASASIPGTAPITGANTATTTTTTRSFYKLFSTIEIPIPIQNTLVTKFPVGPFQDYLYILTAKSKQFLGIKLYEESRLALNLALAELGEQLKSTVTPPPSAAPKNAAYFYNITSLIKLLDWELLFVDLNELFTKWANFIGPNNSKTLPPSVNNNANAGMLNKATTAANSKFVLDLNGKCKEIVRTSFPPNAAAGQQQKAGNAPEFLTPRSEILEMAIMALLNLGEFGFVIEQNLNKWPFLEFLTLLAKVCVDLVDRKDSSSNYRELWYAVLPNFSMNISKRQQANKNAGLVSSRAVFMWVIERAHSQLLISLFVSLLARFHNHVQDDGTLQIHSADFLHIWPNILDDVTTSSEVKSRVSGSSKLNATYIFDVLLTLLNRAQNSEPIWLKCIGDVYLASVNPAQAMKSYLEYLALTTDFYEKHSAPNWNDNALFRRMIKCCEMMQAYTQAVILCQFLTEVDYSLAFGKAQEQMSSDASDSLYGFIWDLAILEFLISLHSKRNEFRKKQQAMKVMGLLELNGNNNEEIQREAMHLRKSQFMRTLAKLYIFT